MYTLQHKGIRSDNRIVKSTMWGRKLATYYSQGTHNLVSQGKWMSCEETKNPNIKLLNGASDWKVSADLKTSLQFLVHIIQTEKQPDIVVWSDSKKTVFLIELTVSWEENWEEAHEWFLLRLVFWTINHFISFKNRNHWSHFESCLKSSSDRGAICINLN